MALTLAELNLVIARAPLPSAFITQMSDELSPILTKATCLPSGDQAGWRFRPPVVICLKLSWVSSQMLPSLATSTRPASVTRFCGFSMTSGGGGW